MGSFSNYAETAVLKHMFKGSAYSQPTNLYIALCKATIEEDDTGSTLPTEVSGGAYARKQCNTWTSPSANTISNGIVLEFAEATANWGTVTDFAVVDSNAGGNIVVYGKLGTAKKVGTGDTAKFATNDIDITLS